MILFLKLALRNVFRYRKRTVITFIAISLGLGMMAIGLSMYKGVDRQAIGNIINSQTSHIKIFARDYFQKKDKYPLEINIEGADRIIKRLKEIKNIQATEERILFRASIISGMDELPCIGIGLDPKNSEPVFNIPASLKEGQFLSPDDRKILIGRGLADDLNLKVGDMCVIRMFSSTEEFVWNAYDLEIKGIVQTENPQVNIQTIFIPLQLAREGLNLEGKSTEIAIRLTDRNAVSRAKKEIKDSIKEYLEGGLEVLSFEELASDFIQMTRFRRRIQAVFPFIMLLIATLGIINTMLMAVMGRYKEIGMLSAMGMRKKEILGLFLLEGVYIGFMGSLTGCLLGGLGGLYLEKNGWNLGGLGSEISNVIASVYPIRDVFYADMTFEILFFTLIFGTFVSVLSSLYPAYRAVKIDPVKALRHI